MKDAIGVIGGMGPLASQLFYKMITEHTAAECDQDHVPLLILSDVTMPDRTGAILDGKYDAPYNRLMEDAKFLEEYGCTAVVVTCSFLRIGFCSRVYGTCRQRVAMGIILEGIAHVGV